MIGQVMMSKKQPAKTVLPSEVTIRVITEQKSRDLVCANEKLKSDLPKLAKKSMQKDGMTCDTVTPEEYEEMSKEEFEL